MKLFCNHKWSVIQDVTSKSVVQRAFDGGLTIKGNIDNDCLMSTHETIVTCSKCGKLNRYVERV